MSNATCPKCGAGASRTTALPPDSAIWACGSYYFGVLTQSKQCRISELENKLAKHVEFWAGMRDSILHDGGLDYSTINSVLSTIDGWERQL